MFPLGTVLLPGMLLPLHVFEPRYRQLVADCQAADGTFGVVLIERGSEVGGGDVRTDVGTLARIARAEELPDGRWVLATVGVHRFRVEAWLPDAPYPRAELVDWPDDPGGAGDLDWNDVTALLRRTAALRRELGEPAAPLDLALAPDPVVASYQAAAVAPVGPADRQRLLAAPSPAARAGLVRAMLVDQIELLRARLAGG